MDPLYRPPLAILGLLDRAFALLRRHALTLFPIAAAFLLPSIVVSALVPLVPTLTLLVTLVSMVCSTIASGALIFACDRALRDESVSIGAAFRGGRGSYWRIFSVSLRQGFAILLLILPTAIVAAWQSSYIVAALAAIVGLLGALLLSTRWMVAETIVVLERQGAGEAMRRSRALVARRFWPSFAVALISGLLVGALTLLPVLLINYMGVVGLGETIGTSLISAIGSIFTVPFGALVQLLLYNDLRSRFEGTDLEAAAAALGAR